MALDDTPIGRLRNSLLGAQVTQAFGCTTLDREPGPPPGSGATCPHFHWGIDLFLAGGTRANVYAPASGYVTFAGWSPSGYGNEVVIRDPHGYTYRLGHMTGLRVAAGQYIDAGTVLGNQGSTGNSTGTHLHLEVRDPSGHPINPARTVQGVVAGQHPAPATVFYTLGHYLGFGYGPTPASIILPPNPQTGAIPAGGTTGAPLDSGGTGDPATDPGTYDTASGTSGSGTASNASFLTFASDPTKGGLLLTHPLRSQYNTTFVSIAVLGVGIVLAWVGLRQVTKESGASVVVNPVVDAGRTVGKAAGAVVAPEAVAAGAGAEAAKEAKERAAQEKQDNRDAARVKREHEAAGRNIKSRQKAFVKAAA